MRTTKRQRHRRSATALSDGFGSETRHAAALMDHGCRRWVFRRAGAAAGTLIRRCAPPSPARGRRRKTSVTPERHPRAQGGHHRGRRHLFQRCCLLQAHHPLESTSPAFSRASPVPKHVIRLLQSASPAPRHVIRLVQSASPAPKHIIRLVQSASPTSKHIIRLLQSASPAPKHVIRFCRAHPAFLQGPHSALSEAPGPALRASPLN